MIGIVKTWSRRNGYGFIRGFDEIEYFVHYTDIIGKRHLTRNRVVEFDQSFSERGARANNVRYS